MKKIYEIDEVMVTSSRVWLSLFIQEVAKSHRIGGIPKLPVPTRMEYEALRALFISLGEPSPRE
jgi:hypothetical protein